MSNVCKKHVKTNGCVLFRQKRKAAMMLPYTLLKTLSKEDGLAETLPDHIACNAEDDYRKEEGQGAFRACHAPCNLCA